MPALSVVVIGRNEGERLRRCLQSVVAIAATVPGGMEIIYVDSGSVDNSVALAESEGARTLKLRPERPTAALGRNAGWQAARGETILFLDGDTILDPNFVAGAMPQFADPQVAVVWGHRRELYPEHSIYNRVLDLDWIYPPGPAPFCGGDALFRRSVLAAAGGYDETLIAGEEPELCRRIMALGFTIYHVDLPMTKHDIAMTRWRQYWKRASRAGHAYAEVSERFANTPNPFWSDECRRNRNRALTLLGLCLAGVLGSFAGVLASIGVWSALPILLVLAVLFALAARTGYKARWKAPSGSLHDAVTLFLYGVHSHLQQIPIFFGQLHYRWNRRKGRRALLVEYKQP
jgi:glycosyltransferase involved in cell wall biosynthesis